MSKDIEEISCEQAIKILLEYLDDELESHDHLVMDKHLHTCRSCYSRMEFEKKLKNTIKNTEEEKAPEELRNKLNKISELF